MDLNWMALLVAGVAIVAAIVALVRKGEPITVATVAEELTDIKAIIEEARMWVMSAQQLYETGRLPQDQRHDWVFRHLKRAFPDLDEATLDSSLEAAVKWMKILQGQSPTPTTPAATVERKHLSGGMTLR